MGLMEKMFGKGGVKGTIKDIVNPPQPLSKKERMRKDYDEAIAKDPNVNRAYLLHNLETKYANKPEYEPQQRPHQREREPKEKSMWDKFVDMGANVNANLERERGFGGGNFGGVFPGIDLQRAAGFGASRQERPHHKKYKKQKQKSGGKTIIIRT